MRGSSRSPWSDDVEVTVSVLKPELGQCFNQSFRVGGTLCGRKIAYVAEWPSILTSFSSSQAEDCWELLPRNAWAVFLFTGSLSPGDHFMFSYYWGLYSVNHSAYMAADQSHLLCQNWASHMWPCVPAHSVHSNVFLRNSSRCWIWCWYFVEHFCICVLQGHCPVIFFFL